MRPGEAEDIERLRQWSENGATDPVTDRNLRRIVLPRILDEYERLHGVVSDIGCDRAHFEIAWNEMDAEEASLPDG